jgi:phosphatidylserine/phosphatidylglycerophosphate/cardiolipin synthase-like enzyme
MRTPGTRLFSTLALLVAVSGCASLGPRGGCPAGTQDLPDCPPLGAIDDPFINALYAERTWVPPGELDFDPIEAGKRAKIPVQSARVKFVGSSSRDGLNSLAAKIWMIENAKHTIDATYYIFKRDLIGGAVLGALCNAVERGVDVRFMVDSLGSLDPTHSGMKGLETCALEAGFMRNADGELTTKKARVQTMVFNAISNVFVNANRRSHDKLLVVDGSFRDRALVMTGGRNISLAYYGILEDGSPDPHAYRDAEILLRPGPESESEEYSVGQVSEAYFGLLFLFDNNQRLKPLIDGVYASDRRDAQEKLATLRSAPVVKERLDAMPEHFSEGWVEAEVVLAHEFGNLTNDDVFEDVAENLRQNPNSIQSVLKTLSSGDFKRVRYVSPYLFAPELYDADGNELHDGARNLERWLEADPERSIEIITNSVLTSDNFPAQSVIDMNMAPRLLLTPELQKAWLESRRDGEMNPDLVESEEWKRLIDHPRIAIYETGRLDARELGGHVDYGKLHAKYIVMDDSGFVGTTNFDYRSRLLNNEMGFFFESPELARELDADFERLKGLSYRWGTPEWLAMRRALFEAEGIKADTARSQRNIYETLRATGLDKQL